MLKNVTSLSSISRKSQNKIPNMKLTCFSRTGMLTPFIENADFVPNGLHHSEWGQINFHINPFIWCWHWRENKSKYIILNFENTTTNTSSLTKGAQFTYGEQYFQSMMMIGMEALILAPLLKNPFEWVEVMDQKFYHPPPV